jgi:hypothetical protein
VRHVRPLPPNVSLLKSWRPSGPCTTSVNSPVWSSVSTETLKPGQAVASTIIAGRPTSRRAKLHLSSFFLQTLRAQRVVDRLPDPQLYARRIEPVVVVCAQAIDAAVTHVGHESLVSLPVRPLEFEEDPSPGVPEAHVARHAPDSPGGVHDVLEDRGPDPALAVPCGGVRGGLHQAPAR